jgi:hypothetical protein
MGYPCRSFREPAYAGKHTISRGQTKVLFCRKSHIVMAGLAAFAEASSAG